MSNVTNSQMQEFMHLTTQNIDKIQHTLEVFHKRQEVLKTKVQEMTNALYDLNNRLEVLEPNDE